MKAFENVQEMSFVSKVLNCTTLILIHSKVTINYDIETNGRLTQDEEGFLQLFQPNSKMIETEQMFLFKPNIIHSGSRIDGTERVLLYLEFSTNEITK